MTLPTHIAIHTYEIYRFAADAALSDMGGQPAVTKANMTKIGEVNGRITYGDSNEPDILGVRRDGGIDLSTYWIGHFNPPSGFEIYVGDYIWNENDSRRCFQVQHLDRYSGGRDDHHYEARLLATEVVSGG
jgi:hypothetical protein